MIEIWAEGCEIKPGTAYGGMPDPLYRAVAGISKSGLDKFAVSPAHYMFEKHNPRPETQALYFGRALSCIILQPDEFDRLYYPLPAYAPKKPTRAQRAAKKPSADTLSAIAWWDEWHATHEGMIEISNKNDPDLGVWGLDDWDTLQAMRDALMSHPYAGILIHPEDTITEGSMFWVDGGTRRLCKGRYDAYNTAHRVMIDLKSTMDAGMSQFARSVAEYRYHVQDAYYRIGADKCAIDVRTFLFIAIEKNPPYGIGIYEIAQEWIEQAQTIIRDQLKHYDECMSSGNWPCYDPQPRQLDLPGYAKFIKVS